MLVPCLGDNKSFAETLERRKESGDGEQRQGTSRGALREGSPDLRGARGPRLGGVDREWRDHLIGGASRQDLPHRRSRRTKRLRGEEHGDYRRGYHPLLPSGVLFLGARGYPGA